MTNGPPYLLALIIGLLVSATIYFVWVWPQREPEDDEPGDGDEPD
jgi:hypothetical protein